VAETRNGSPEATRRHTALSTRWNSTARYSVSYPNRDLLGRVTSKVEVIGGVSTTTTYGYDTAGRLTSESVGGVTTTWDYDLNGNRTTKNGATVSTADAQDRINGESNLGVTYTYNDSGSRATKVDASGTTTYTWDSFGNLKSVKRPGFAAPDIEYVYDGQNRRVGKKVAGALQKFWLYDGQLRIVAELDGAGVTQKRFVYGSRSHVPDTMVDASGTYRLVVDQLGSVRMLINVSTGAINQQTRFDAWGVPTFEAGTAAAQPFGFAGGLYDADTGLTHFGARDYDAAVGRWVSKDPIRFDGGYNLYAYAENDPVNMVDTTGNDAVGAAAGAAAGFFFGGLPGSVEGGALGYFFWDIPKPGERRPPNQCGDGTPEVQGKVTCFCKVGGPFQASSCSKCAESGYCGEGNVASCKKN
jgi:RHS repeat-associated protein